jgi:hypothetical protein
MESPTGGDTSEESKYLVCNDHLQVWKGKTDEKEGREGRKEEREGKKVNWRQGRQTGRKEV